LLWRLGLGESRVAVSCMSLTLTLQAMSLIGSVVTVTSSQVTTVADEMELEPKVSEEDVLFAEIDALEQGRRELLEYLGSAEGVFMRAPAQWERYIAEAFVAGIANEGVRALVEGDLDREGWTWQRASETVRRIVDQGERKRRKRYIVPPGEMEGYMNITP